MLLSGNMALMYLLDVCTMAFFFFFLFTILPFTSFRKMSAVCRKKTGWHLAPEKHNKLIEKKNPKLIVCGDSIVSGLGRYKDVWQTYINEMTVNLGEPGDRVEHLIWRLQKLCPSRFITTYKYYVVRIILRKIVLKELLVCYSSVAVFWQVGVFAWC